MGDWILHSEDSRMEDWLKASLSDRCQYCGSQMMNYYNDDWRCTNRRCSNNDCCGMKAARADFMFKQIGVKGIGFATCLAEARNMAGESHVAMLGKYSKPTITLYDYLRIHCFEGIDSLWETICVTNGYYSLDDIMTNYFGKERVILENNKELLYNNLKYVNLKGKPVTHFSGGPELTYTVMVTGTPNGYASKEDFFEQLNAAMMGRIVLVHQKTVRQSGVDFLVREPGSTTRTKVEAAQKAGIPIVTSDELVAFLITKMEKLNSEIEQ